MTARKQAAPSLIKPYTKAKRVAYFLARTIAIVVLRQLKSSYKLRSWFGRRSGFPEQSARRLERAFTSGRQTAAALNRRSGRNGRSIRPVVWLLLFRKIDAIHLDDKERKSAESFRKATAGSQLERAGTFGYKLFRDQLTPASLDTAPVVANIELNTAALKVD
ncbi:hypothetical protein M514_07289 [Trichuris suis]|uniref:Uncharacterized protein n=1 Tax=Trichuris suis TaxID=68888 RepID=A0A085N411_9BILA|nr:hypothetical protein M514_07289 [Trichuris suis]